MLVLNLNNNTIVSNILDFTHIEFGVIRTLIINEEPWFVGKDIAKLLKYTNTRKAIRDHVDAEDKRIIDMNKGTIRSPIQGNPNTVIINESGLYSLIFKSKLKSAKKFKRWVTNEVLPSIRRYGAYIDSNHPNIRELSKFIRKDCVSHIAYLIEYGKSINPNLDEDQVYSILSVIANELAGIKTGQRDSATTEQLLKLICIETSFMRTILSCVNKGKDIIKVKLL